jgi:hypothetical protein
VKSEGSVAVITGAASGLGLATAPKEPQDPTEDASPPLTPRGHARRPVPGAPAVFRSGAGTSSRPSSATYRQG